MLNTLGKTAIFNEKEYEFVDLDNGEYIIINVEAEIGFEKINNRRYIKKVNLDEISFVFDKNTEVSYMGDSFIGSIIKNNKIMLYTRDVTLGKKYNMTMRDKDEYYLYVDLKDVDEIVQRWLPCSKYNKDI